MCIAPIITVDKKRFRLTARCRRDLGGFTLVEMLIALVLSSIIFFSSYQVISNLIQYQVRAQVKNSEHLDKLLLENLLSQIIEKSIDQNDLYHRTQKKTVFRGGNDSIQLVSRAYSERYDVPGYRVYRLYERDEELQVSYRAFDGNYLSNQQFQLATGLMIKNLSFEYLEQNGWVEEWSDESSIPGSIRIKTDLPGLGSTEWVKRTSRR